MVDCSLKLKKLSRDQIDLLDSKLAPKSPLQHSRQERVQLGGGLRLVALEGVELELHAIKVSNNSMLFL